MQALFDAYLMVDWSAAAHAQTGADSIWIAAVERSEDGSLGPLRLSNPPLRRAAIAELADMLSDLVARNRTALVGFDFAFGYPAGFARQLCPERPDWRGVWRTIAGRISDDDANANNRFAVAGEFNARISGRAFPFWGCPPGDAKPTLSARRPLGFAANGSDGDDAGIATGLREFRWTDRAASGPQPVWKLAYPGSVGSQTLLGIAHLEALRRHPWLDGKARIWPFETGLKPMIRPAEDDWRLLFAEIYPSMLPVETRPGEVKDAAQVRTVVSHFAKLDQQGRLAVLFAGPSDLSAEQRQAIETEEAWILGIETTARARPMAVASTPSPYTYLRDPEEIYRRSFAAIRAEADLTEVAAEAEPLAIRLIHATGEPAIVADLIVSANAIAAARAALAAGAPILVDAEMVAAGIIRSRLPAGNPVICTLGDLGVGEAARAAGTTRSAAAVDRWRPHMQGAVVAIGNAPTALFRLLELIDLGAPRPAVILGFPVGFVGAAESKEALIAHGAGIPFVSLRGRRGGSAIAAAAVNALAGEIP